MIIVVATGTLAFVTFSSPSASKSSSSSSAVSLASSSQGTETTSYTGPGSATVTTNSSSLGLKLTLSVNSTMIPSQDAIHITTSVLNTLPTANNLTASNAWAIGGLSAGPCDLGNSTNKLFFPVGIGVFRGTYGLNNLSSAGKPLSVWALVECVSDGVSVGNQYYPLHSITSYSLLAGRDNGTYAGYYAVPGAQPPPVCNSGVCTYTANNTESLAKGTFPTRMAVQESIYAANSTAGLGYNSLGSSLPANYTLVAGDEWGQLTILHFSVVASHNLPEVGSFLANGGGCAENNNPVPCTASGFSQAFIFNCAAQAASTSGCTAQVPSSGPWSAKSYTITVWYPYSGKSGEPSGDNCMFSVPGDTGSPYAYCFMVNSTAFALSP